MTAAPAAGKPKGLLANAGAMFAARVVVAVFGWAGTLLIIRTLDKSEWGKYTFVFGFLALVGVLSNSVNARVAIHGLMKDDADRFAGSYVTLRALLGLLTYCIALSIVVLAGYPSIVVELTAIAGVVILLATPSNGYDAIFQLNMRLDRIGLALVFGQLAQFVLIGLVAIVGGSLVLFTIPVVVCEIVILSLKLWWIRPLQRVRYVREAHRWGAMMRESVPLAIGTGLAAAYYSVDAVMLSKMDTFRAVGTYGIAYKFAGLLGFLPTAMSAAALGLLARSWPGDLVAFRRALHRASMTLLIVAVLAVVEFVFFSDEAIRLLYGGEYVSAANSTRIVVAGECLGFFTNLGITAFAAMSRNRLYAIAALVGLVFNVAVNLVVIPEFSFQGAAWVTFGTEALVLSVIWVPLTRTLGYLPVQPALFAKIAGAGLVAAGVGAATHDRVPWSVAGLLVAGSFALVLFLLRVPGGEGFATPVQPIQWRLEDDDSMEIRWQAPVGPSEPLLP